MGGDRLRDPMACEWTAQGVNRPSGAGVRVEGVPGTTLLPLGRAGCVPG